MDEYKHTSDDRIDQYIYQIRKNGIDRDRTATDDIVPDLLDENINIKMDLYQVQAPDFINHCIQQMKQKNTDDADTMDSEVPELLEEDQENLQKCDPENHLERNIGEDSITL
jgi:hypothetical protein